MAGVPLEYCPNRTRLGRLRFAHIPAGVLSQVYEASVIGPTRRSGYQCPLHAARHRRTDGRGAFAATKDKAGAKLPIARRRGDFLVLVPCSSASSGEAAKPTTRHPDILYKQVRGFDISESPCDCRARALHHCHRTQCQPTSAAGTRPRAIYAAKCSAVLVA
jgi:hypothetical protein